VDSPIPVKATSPIEKTDSAPIGKSKLIVTMRVYMGKAIMTVFSDRVRERERNNSTHHPFLLRAGFDNHTGCVVGEPG
jgi:hypothetical protein